MAQLVSSLLLDNFKSNKDVKSCLVLGECNDDIHDVSILMPIYNHSKFLREAILSCVNQDCSFNYDIIIVDNNHPQFQSENEKIVRELNFSKIKYYVNEKNIGACGNWNRCIELADAKYVTFCHDDDMLSSDALSQLMKQKLEIGTKAMVVGLVDRVNSKNEVVVRKTEGIIRKLFRKERIKLKKSDFYISNYSNGGGTLYDKGCLMSLGGFDSNMIPCFDYALNAIYMHFFDAIQINKVTLLYRISEENDSWTCYVDIPQTNKRIRSFLAKLSNNRKLTIILVSFLENLDNACLKATENTINNRSNNLPVFLKYNFCKILVLFRDFKNYILR